MENMIVKKYDKDLVCGGKLRQCSLRYKKYKLYELMSCVATIPL